VVEDSRPRRRATWDPFWGLTPIARLICVLITTVISWAVYSASQAIIAPWVDRLFSTLGR
jgi:hypothetical protein